MYCMKCGREAENGQVFCPECLETMKQEPVAMNTAVNLPKQPPKNPAARRQAIHLEDEVRRLEKSGERLRAWVLLLAMATLLLAMALFHDEIVAREDTGRNYAIIEPFQIP